MGIMSSLNEKEKSMLDQLQGLTLKTFTYLLRVQEPVGPSQVKRALGLKTASHASYHLGKLVELGIVERSSRNTYQLKPEFRIKSLRVSVMIDYYWFHGRFWPRNAFSAAFMVFSFLTSLVLLFLDEILVLKIFVVLALMVSVILLSSDVWYHRKAFEDSFQAPKE